MRVVSSAEVDADCGDVAGAAEGKWEGVDPACGAAAGAELCAALEDEELRAGACVAGVCAAPETEAPTAATTSNAEARAIHIEIAPPMPRRIRHPKTHDNTRYPPLAGVASLRRR